MIKKRRPDTGHSHNPDAVRKRETRVRDRMDEKVDKACLAAGHKKVRVLYSAYETDEDDVPVDNLHEAAARGRVRLIAGPDEYRGGEKSRAYRSAVLEDPTRLDVCVCANEMIRVTRDGHHVFLEGVSPLPKRQQTEPGVTLYEFDMGS